LASRIVQLLSARKNISYVVSYRRAVPLR